jgi:hypothetical protein
MDGLSWPKFKSAAAMKNQMQWMAVAFLGLGLASTPAQEATNLNQQVEQLQRQLKQTQESFERILQAQQQTIDALKRQVEAMQPASAKLGAPTGGTPAALGEAGNAPAPEKKWSPSDPIQIQSGKSFMNIGLVGTMAAGGSTARDIEGGTQLGGHDPTQNGFTLQGLEMSLNGAVDPYFRANANVLYQVDSAGASRVELEEAWMETLSLPGRLQLRAGQILSEFGRMNATHPHTWTTVDTPLVLGRLLGPDGLRNLGARISWLAPTPFYSELFLGIQNSHGDTAYSFRSDHGGEPYMGRLNPVTRTSGVGDLLFTPRYAMSFDLTDTQTLVAGLSGAFGPNSSGKDTTTQIYGVDLYWKWKAPRQVGGFPFVSFQAEGLMRRYQAGAFSWDLNGDGLLGAGERDLNGDGVPDMLPRETLVDYGTYAQVAWGFRPGWVAALRGDYVAARMSDYERMYGVDPMRATRWRLSPNLTWYPSEFSKIRLQYNYDDRDTIGVDHSIWLQWEFSLGAHAAHKF